MTEISIYDRDGEFHAIALPTDTRNYGDVNPQAHGGVFAGYDDMGVSVVKTVPPQDLPDDFCHGEHLVTETFGYYDDLIDHTDTESVARGVLDREIAASGRCDSLVQAAIDGHLPAMLAWATERYHGRDERFVSDSEYAETMINNYSVPEELL